MVEQCLAARYCRRGTGLRGLHRLEESYAQRSSGHMGLGHHVTARRLRHDCGRKRSGRFQYGYADACDVRFQAAVDPTSIDLDETPRGTQRLEFGVDRPLNDHDQRCETVDRRDSGFSYVLDGEILLNSRSRSN